MEMDIKTMEGENNNPVAETKKLTQAEWCFQFDGEEPIIFAWSKEEGDVGDFVLNIPAIEGTAATFKCPRTGKSFSILVREMSEETKADRDRMMSEQGQ